MCWAPPKAFAQVRVDGRAGFGAVFGGVAGTESSGLFAIGVGTGRFHVRLDVQYGGGRYGEDWIADLALQIDIVRGPVQRPTIYLLDGIGWVTPSSLFDDDEYAVIVLGGGVQFPLTGVLGLFAEARGYLALSPPPEGGSVGSLHVGIRLGAP
jgi:hypothetical protein